MLLHCTISPVVSVPVVASKSSSTVWLPAFPWIEVSASNGIQLFSLNRTNSKLHFTRTADTVGDAPGFTKRMLEFHLAGTNHAERSSRNLRCISTSVSTFPTRPGKWRNSDSPTTLLLKLFNARYTSYWKNSFQPLDRIVFFYVGGQVFERHDGRWEAGTRGTFLVRTRRNWSPDWTSNQRTDHFQRHSLGAQHFFLRRLIFFLNFSKTFHIFP